VPSLIPQHAVILGPPNNPPCEQLRGKVEAGDLSFEDAMNIFERAREQAIEQRRQEQPLPQSPTSP